MISTSGLMYFSQSVKRLTLPPASWKQYSLSFAFEENVNGTNQSLLSLAAALPISAKGFCCMVSLTKAAKSRITGFFQRLATAIFILNVFSKLLRNCTAMIESIPKDLKVQQGFTFETGALISWATAAIITFSMNVRRSFAD